jgi:hypothetical protein
MLWCSKVRVAGLASLSDAPVGVTAVRSKEAAKKAVRVWIQAAKQGNRVFAVDTEVANIDLSFESPVGHGNVICASVYGGPDLDFGNGPKLWIDNHGDAEGVLQEFKDVLESPDVLKVAVTCGNGCEKRSWRTVTKLTTSRSGSGVSQLRL